jgi:hypothetical protein
MSDEQTMSQGNTNGEAVTPSEEGGLLTQATDTTKVASEEEALDPTETKTAGEDDGSGEKVEGEGDDQNETPEEYKDFNLPEGFEALDETLLADAIPLFKESGLSKEQAQKYIDIYAKTIQSQSETRSQAFTDLNNNNIKAIKEHPTLGGSNLDGSLVHVARAIDAVMGKNAAVFRDMLDQTGLGNQPMMFELLAKVGKSVGEDGNVTGGKTSVKTSQAEVMYGKDGTGKSKEA